MVAPTVRGLNTPQLDMSAVEIKASNVATSPIPMRASCSTVRMHRSIANPDDPITGSLGKQAIDKDSDRMLIGSGMSRSKHYIRPRPRSASVAFGLPTLFPNSLARKSVEKRRTSMTFVLPESESMWCVPSTASGTSWSVAVQSDKQELSSASSATVANLHSDLLSATPTMMTPDSSSGIHSNPHATPLSSNHSWSSSRRLLTSPDKAVQSRPRSIRSFNARLNSFAQKGHYAEIIALLDSVHRGELEIATPLNTYSYTILVKAYCNAGNIEAAEQLLHEMDSFVPSQRPNRFTYNILLNACVRSENLHKASNLFKIMEMSSDEELHPDHVSYTTLMKGYATGGDMDAAQVLLSRLMTHPDPLYRPNHVTYNTMLKGFAGNNDLEGAERLLAHMYEGSSCQPDLVSMNTIIGGYCRINDMANAERLFSPMLHSTKTCGIVPNTVTFQAMIEGYIRVNNSNDADRLIRELDQRFGKEVSAQVINAAIGRASQTSEPAVSARPGRPVCNELVAAVERVEPAELVETVAPVVPVEDLDKAGFVEPVKPLYTESFAATDRAVPVA